MVQKNHVSTLTTTKKIITVLVVLLLGCTYGFSRKLAALPELNNPTIIESDGKEIYVLDNVEVKVYSLKDYSLLRTFGKKGHGPGELMPNDEIPLQMQVKNGQVFLNSQTKFIHYSKTGRMIKEKATTFMCMQIVPLANRYAISKVGFDNFGKIFFRIILYNQSLEELKTIYTTGKSSTLRSSGKIIVPANFTYMTVDENRLFVFSGRQEDFIIRVFDTDGRLLKPVTMEYQRPKWTDTFKKEVTQWAKQWTRFRGLPVEVEKLLEFPRYLPAIRNVIAKDSNVYVQTYKKKNNRSEFFIFDRNGKMVNKLFLPDASPYKVKTNPDITFTITGNKYYYLMENLEKEEWELHETSL